MKTNIFLYKIRRYILTGAALILACCLTGCSGVWEDALPRTKVEQDREAQELQTEQYYGTQNEGHQQAQQTSAEKYAYRQLGQEAQAVYDEVLQTIVEHGTGKTLSTTDPELLELAFYSVRADYGGLFWVDGYTYTEYSSGGQVTELEFSPKYTMSRQERQEIQAAIDVSVEGLLGGISSADSDYQKARFVFDTLVRTVEYDPEAENSQNIISVFLQGRTVCQGYACAVQYLFDLLDMPCTIVTGTAEGEAHAWNLVMLDGDYYYMDVTWGNSAYQNGESGREKYVNYSYFAMTGEDLLLSHEPDGFLPMPECTQQKDSYFVQEGCYFTDWYPEEIGSVLSRLEYGMVSLKFADEALYRQACGYFIEEQHVRDYFGVGDSFYYMTDDDLLVLTFLGDG